MGLTVHERFERSCRLCAEEQEVSVMIFSPEAEAMLLKNKLNKYLLLEIDEDDKLPKNVCLSCCSKLHAVSNFIDSAHEAQEILINRSLLLCDNTIGNSVLHSELIIPDDIKTEPITLEEDSESDGNRMEISVDPMIVLQNSESEGFTQTNDNAIDVADDIADDITYINGADGEKVTIKLLKKDEIPAEDTDRKKSNEKPFSCGICKKKYCTELALKSHTWSHTSEDKTSKTYTCETCNNSFEHLCLLRTHMKEHSLTNISTCDLCGRFFRNPKNLQDHKETHKISYKVHACNICGRAYDKISNLKNHSITHSTERPFKCHLCKKCFKRKQDLQFHINQHTGAKPYKCPFCEKCFASSGNCYAHRNRMHPGRKVEPKIKGRRRMMITVPKDLAASTQARTIVPPKIKTVNGVYKYQCPICNKTCMRKDNYDYHIYQHTGEKPYQCIVCTEKFVTKKGLLLHHENKHEKIIENDN